MPGNFLVCPDGAALVSGAGVPSCSVPWEVHHTDTLNQIVDALNLAFQVPPIDQLTVIMTAAFSLPMFAFVVSRGFGDMMSMFSSKYDK